MTSAVGICNLALAHLGDAAIVSSIDPPEGSAQADHCAMFYPIARDTMLEIIPWSFSTKRITGAALVCDREEWGFAYAVPNKALRVLGVYSPGARTEDESAPFIQELNVSDTEVIYTDVEGAIIQYAVSVTDTGKFSPLFVQTLAWHLASMLAGPVVKGDAGRAEEKRCAQMAAFWLGKASVSNVNQHHNPMKYTPPHLATR